MVLRKLLVFGVLCLLTVRARECSEIFVMSDVDDTLYAAGKVGVAGSDTKFPAHAMYPGVAAFDHALALGDRMLKSVSEMIVLSARPSQLRKFLAISKSHLIAQEFDKYWGQSEAAATRGFGTMASALSAFGDIGQPNLNLPDAEQDGLELQLSKYGNLWDNLEFRKRHKFVKYAKTKLQGYNKYVTDRIENNGSRKSAKRQAGMCFIFLGDNGQGDELVGRYMLGDTGATDIKGFSVSEKGLALSEAVFIHDTAPDSVRSVTQRFSPFEEVRNGGASTPGRPQARTTANYAHQQKVEAFRYIQTMRLVNKKMNELDSSIEIWQTKYLRASGYAEVPSNDDEIDEIWPNPMKAHAAVGEYLTMLHSNLRHYRIEKSRTNFKLLAQVRAVCAENFPDAKDRLSWRGASKIDLNAKRRPNNDRSVVEDNDLDDEAIDKCAAAGRILREKLATASKKLVESTLPPKDKKVNGKYYIYFKTYPEAAMRARRAGLISLPSLHDVIRNVEKDFRYKACVGEVENACGFTLNGVDRGIGGTDCCPDLIDGMEMAKICYDHDCIDEDEGVSSRIHAPLHRTMGIRTNKGSDDVTWFHVGEVLEKQAAEYARKAVGEANTKPASHRTGK